MRLEQCVIPSWPKLSWVARCPRGSETVTVYHGPMVETSDQWAVEAVWVGPFEEGGFDRTDLVFGTGVRLRDNDVVFVASGTVFDRLWHCRKDDSVFVSNSLPVLLAVTGWDLVSEYPDYAADARSVMRGLEEGNRTIPANGGDVHMHYYHNLVWCDGELRVEKKPDTAPEFQSYEDYRAFLRETSESLAGNMSSPQRDHAVTPITSISSGYDSCVAAVVACDAGCTQAVTIDKATSLWRGSDSGEPIARALGLTCRTYGRVPRDVPHELALWAGEGRPGILNWTQFDFPQPLSLLFTGCHGEKMWDRVSHDHPDPFVRRDPSSLGFCEFRLHVGVFQTAVPFWGVRHSRELHEITAREMKPWYFGPDAYDKPIARRITEEADVQRNAFGQSNKNTSLESRFLWPFSPRMQEDFAAYLRDHGVEGFSVRCAGWMRLMSKLESLLYMNVLKRMGLQRRRWQWDRLRRESWPFKWANQRLRDRYAAGLAESGFEAGA